MKEKKFQECKIRIKSSTSSPKFSSNQVPPHELQPQDYEKFFNWWRIKRPWTWMSIIGLILYFPIGIVLMFTRLILELFFAIFVSLTSQWAGHWAHEALLHFCGKCAGFFFKIENKERLSYLKHSTCIIVANHTFNFDPFGFRAFMCISVLMAKKYSQIRGLTPFLKILNPLFVEEDRSKARQAILEHLQHPERPPLVVFPEGGLTNGRFGLMRFEQFVFSLDQPILPITITVESPFLELDSVSGTAFRNIFYMFFRPYHIFRLKVLPLQYIRKSTNISSSHSSNGGHPSNFLSSTEISDAQERNTSHELNEDFLSNSNRHPSDDFTSKTNQIAASEVDETPIAFAKRVQEMMARELGIYATDFSYKEKIAFLSQRKKQNSLKTWSVYFKESCQPFLQLIRETWRFNSEENKNQQIINQIFNDEKSSKETSLNNDKPMKRENKINSSLNIT